jgi:hypothetical protein
VQEAVDARLLAAAIGWAGQAVAARNQIYNVTNGDVFSWADIWPTIADIFGMEVGEPRPVRLAEVMPGRAGEWADLVDRHDLCVPRQMAGFVGASWAYADILLGSIGRRALPSLLSTVKIRQAGFSDCIDTEDMFRYWFAELRRRRWFPPLD